MESKSTQTEPANEHLEILEARKILNVKWSNLDDSKFREFCMNNACIEDVCATGVKIMDANLSDLEIEGAQLGGAYIHNIGMPPKGHPNYDPAAKQRPLTFENCDLNNSTITDCNLNNVSITDCNLTGMTINGILVEDLLKAYNV
ncbi:Pentapeptide repeat-containing protein [Mucilaginibacter sp. OK098]|nr:Pentapeptide repeat-containing protein [Mucilaginibacter sp. OK098]